MTAAQRLSADRLIEAKGQAVTLTRQASGEYNPATGAASITTTTQTGKGVILPFAVGLRKMAGGNVVMGDAQCLLSALDTAGEPLDPAPVVGDKLTDAAGKAHEITEVNPLQPAGMALIYDLTVRAAA